MVEFTKYRSVKVENAWNLVVNTSNFKVKNKLVDNN